MKKTKFIGIILMIFALGISLASCAKKGNEVTKEQWDIASEGNYPNVTIVYTYISSGRGPLENLSTSHSINVSKEDLEALKKDEDLMFKSTNEYRYNEDYYHYKQGKDEFINTNIKIDILGDKPLNEFYAIASDVKESTTNHVAGYKNFSYFFDDTTFMLVEKNEWCADQIGIIKYSTAYEKIKDFDNYIFNSSKGCYEYTKEKYSTTGSAEEIVIGKTVTEISFIGDKPSKIVIYDYETESYRNSRLYNTFIPSEDDEFVLFSKSITEFKNYGTTKIELPKEVQALMAE